MAGLKIALIGAGSFVFGPSVLSQTFLEHQLSDVELALMDVDAEVLELMAGVGRRMARERGLNSFVTTHTDREAALAGADFVIHTAAPQMRRRHAMDLAIIEETIPGHLVSEFGGIAGISYSLRQIALIEAIASDMRRLCPDSWLLDIANPLPRVTQAAQDAGIQTAGFCSVAITGYAQVWKLLTGESISYPYTTARERLQVTSGGLNHFAWVTEITDRETEEDFYPAVRQKLAEGVSSGNPVSERLARETGWLLVPADNHTYDFLPPSADTNVHHGEPWHGGEAERQERLRLLKAVGEGTAAWEPLLEKEAWERPLDFIAALKRDVPASFHSLNLPNTGQIPELPTGVFVETPVSARGGKAIPETISLPAAVVPLCERTVAVTQAIVQASQQNSRHLVHQAVERDPTVLDKAKGIEAINRCLDAHADLIGVYR